MCLWKERCKARGSEGLCSSPILGLPSQLSVRRVPQYRCLCRVSSSHGKENPQLYFQCKVTTPCQAVQAKRESGLPSELSSLTPLSKLRVVNTQV